MPEKPFVPGIDPGLKAWLKMRQEVRDSRDRAGNRLTITSETPYRYHRIWIDMLYSMDADQLDEFYATKANNNIIPWNSIEFKNVTSYEQFVSELQQPNPDVEHIYLDAVQHRSVILINLLLKRGWDLNHQFGPQSRTLLHYACHYGDLAKVQFLIDHQADTVVADLKGLTALHLSIQDESVFHSKQILDELMGCGANVNQPDNAGKTPLHLACIIQSPTMVDTLLSHGADMSIKDHDRKLPCDYTSQAKILKLFEFYSINEGRKQEYMKVQALLLSRTVVEEVFRFVQPKCSVCKRTQSKCNEMKASNYRYWMFAHSRLVKEIPNKPKPQQPS